MLNPIWKKYVALQMPTWLEWIANNPLISHIEMLQRFILTHPYYIPNFDEDNSSTELLMNIFNNEDFINSLSPKGIDIWYHSNISEFKDVLIVYNEKYPDLNLIINLISKYEWWFERTYSEFKKNILIQYQSLGGNFK
tara:strand:+ start:966 stop:1379 length:414 start_codon:yes stop_codon:yes gene_type:complete